MSWPPVRELCRCSADIPCEQPTQLKLGAALVLAESDVSSIPFVALDRRLGEAARREGFRVLTWPDDC